MIYLLPSDVWASLRSIGCHSLLLQLWWAAARCPQAEVLLAAGFRRRRKVTCCCYKLCDRQKKKRKQKNIYNFSVWDQLSISLLYHTHTQKEGIREMQIKTKGVYCHVNNSWVTSEILPLLSTTNAA